MNMTVSDFHTSPSYVA